MVPESQDPILIIEQALAELRREHRGREGRMRGEGGPPRGGRDAAAHNHDADASAGGPGWGAAWEGPGAPPPERGRGHRGGPHLAGAARFRLLDALLAAEASGTRIGVSEVAEAIGVDQPRASRLVNDAVERGLVLRRPDEKDARRAVIEIAEAGRVMLETARANRRGAVTRAVEGFSADERETFAALLSRFVAGWPRT